MDVHHVIYLFVFVKDNCAVASGFYCQILLCVKIAADIYVAGLAGNRKILSGCFQFAVGQDITVITGNFQSAAGNFTGYVYLSFRRVVMQLCQIPCCYVAFYCHIAVFPFAGHVRINLYRNVHRIYVAGHEETATCQSL